MKVFLVQMIDLGLFFRHLNSRDVAMATNFVKNGKLPTFAALAETEWDNAVYMHD